LRRLTSDGGIDVSQVSAEPTAACGATNVRALPRAVAFWVVAAMAAMVPAASSAPSPLYPVYQAEFGFSALTLTVIFAVYVLALMASLLTVGRLSDYLGRRVVLAVVRCAPQWPQKSTICSKTSSGVPQNSTPASISSSTLANCMDMTRPSLV